MYRSLQILMVVLAGLLLAACPQEEPPKNVQVTVLAILATERDSKVDDAIRCIAEEVRKSHPELTGFKLKRTTCKSIPVGGEETFALVDDRVATVVVNSGADKKNWVGVTIKGAGLGGITYSGICGKCIPFKTKYYTKQKEWLFVAVLCKPCYKGK